MSKKTKISRLFFYLIFSTTVALSFVFACLWIHNEYEGYKQEVYQTQTQYIDINKSVIKKEVQSIVQYIEYRKSVARSNLETELKDRTNEAHDTAMDIYNKYHSKMPDTEVKELIKTVLRSSKFNNGRRYFFAGNLDGKIEIAADPAREGKNLLGLQDESGKFFIKEMIRTALENGEGFLEYVWPKPNQEDGSFPKISFVKYFEPYNLFIGTGEYLDVLEKDIQKEILQWLNEFQCSKDSYIAAFTFDGVRIAFFKKEQLGLTKWDYADQNGIKVVQEGIRLAQEEGGGFVDYIASLRPTTGTTSRKISYFMGISDWQWAISTGVYLDDMDAFVAGKKSELSRNISRSIISAILFFLVITGGFSVALSYISRRMNASFQAFSTFFDRAAKESSLIDAGKLDFFEFHRLAISANRMVREREIAEEALRASESRYRAVVEDQAELICRFLPDFTIIFANDAYCRFFDKEYGDPIGQNFLEYVHEADLLSLRRHIDSLDWENSVGTIEHRMVNPKGMFDWVQWTDRAIFDADGNLIEFQAVGRNITERKRAENALLESERRFREMLERVKLAAIIIDTQGTVTFCNDFLLNLLGLPKEKVIGKNWFEEFIPAEKRRELQIRFIEKILTGELPPYFENEICTADGERKLIAWNNTFLRDFEGRVIGRTSIGEDITDRKQTETALQELARFQQQVIDTLPIPVFYKDSEACYLGCNKAFEHFLGKSSKEIVGKSVYDLAPKELADAYHEMDMALIRDHGSQVYESHVSGAGDSERTVIFHKATFPRPDGSIGGLIGAIIDITERKRAEEERIRLVTAIEQSAEAVFMTDTDLVIHYVNPAFERLSGYDRCEIIGKKTTILKSDKHDKAFFRSIRQALLEGEVWSGTLTVKKKDGKTYEAEATASPVRDKSGKLINYVSIHRDITHEVKLEKELRQAQKMEAIGTLAGGIAHDFNNILTAIIGYSEIARSRVPDGTPLGQNLDQVLKAGARAKDLVKQILTFSRQTEQERKPVQVAPIIKEALKLLRSSLPTTIEIRQSIRIKPEEAVILSEPTLIHQVLMNLCTNAGHAMRARGGILSVSLLKVDIDKQLSSQTRDLSPGPYVKIMVSDTGHGIDAPVIERIFDPYFTTKRPGEGTGMGLAVVQGIVKQHGGAVTVYSEAGKGTTFSVYFPRIADEVSPIMETMESLPCGCERILFIDDEKGLAELGKEMLESLGYKVTAKTSSIEALEAFNSVPDDFDLIITDMTMPGLTGIELTREMTAIRPGLPVILCTGFSEILMGSQPKDLGIAELLMKPYAIIAMANAIRNALDKANGNPAKKV